MLQKEIFKKIARNEPLTPQEIDEFSQFGDTLQNLAAVITPRNGGVFSDSFYGNKALFEQNPSQGISLWNSASPNVVDSTATVVQWSENLGSYYFNRDGSDNTKIIPVKLGVGRMVVAFGNIQFAHSDVGRRQCFIRQYDESNNILQGTDLCSVPATPDTSGHYPFAGAVIMEHLAVYWKFFVVQTSGGNLTMDLANLNLAVLY